MLFESFAYRKPTDEENFKGKILERLLFSMGSYYAANWNHAKNKAVIKSIIHGVDVVDPQVFIKTVCLDPPKKAQPSYYVSGGSCMVNF